MRFQRAILILSFFLLAGCMGKYVESEKIRGQVDVFGVALFSSVDYKEIKGVMATEEPCLKGYDRSFGALDVTVGYGFNKKIRKIITRNSNTSLFGVSPGMPFEEGRRKVLEAGFIEAGSPYRFRADGFSLALFVDGSQKIFGVAVELLD
jgi:hypothetical protein